MTIILAQQRDIISLSLSCTPLIGNFTDHVGYSQIHLQYRYRCYRYACQSTQHTLHLSSFNRAR